MSEIISDHNLMTVEIKDKDTGAIILSGKYRSIQEAIQSNATNVSFKNADFRGLVLEYINLTGADIRNADFTGANLRNAFLQQCDARGTNFTNANLRHATFVGSNLIGANFTNANIICVDFDQTLLLDVIGIVFPIVDIRGQTTSLHYSSGKLLIGCIQDTIENYLNETIYKNYSEVATGGKEILAEFHRYIPFVKELLAEYNSKETKETKETK